MKGRISEKNSRIIRFLTEDRHHILRQVAMLASFVMLYLSARMLFDIGQYDNYSGNYGTYHAALPFVIFTFILYLNIYALMPLFFKGKYVQYFWLMILLIMAGLLVMRYISITFFDPHRLNAERRQVNTVVEIIAATIFTTPIVLATTAARLMQKWIRDLERIDELNNITINMELMALKNQINPHFLFNMLNNVNTLVHASPSKASEVIVKLSEFLRYQLYENDSETTSLMEECTFLSNFLNLEKVRRDNFTFSINCATPGTNTATVRIPPNLFTTFVENAIKHSVDISGTEAYIAIAITAQGGLLHFDCTNSKDPEEIPNGTANGGLGLANIKRRLQLLYGDSYTLVCSSEAALYNIKLTFPYEMHYS
ncbi:histidine kinase [uncultured Flavobacterium sp.]|uniref:sensor histidine kinase n=1 Tax=uncultured Flavobacterium sp. TaxID=165435 RepID=UPI0025FE42D8|nr:histidine kinase [uncultured Flavobacterium sp.]